MKKILLLIIFIPSILAAQEFVINTSRGDVTLAIPEDMTLEEAYKEMASLYLEERYDLGEALDTIDELAEEVREYVAEIDTLNDEIDNYQEEVERYTSLLEEANKPRLITPIASVGGGVTESFYYGQASFGVQFFENIFVTADMSYPFRLGASVGMTF